jgi:hypothetical protein
MDQCTEQIARQPEWQGDQTLAALVRTQLIVYQLHRGSSQSSDYGAPLSSFHSTLQARLHNIKISTPLRIDRNGLAPMYS